MKSNNKIYSIFILLALLFWNPISYFLIYTNTPIYSIKAIHIFYWIVFIGGILTVILIQKNIFNDKVKNIIFTIAFIGILFSAFVLVDRAIGLVSGNKKTQVQQQEWLIFEPNSNARYQTLEFDWVANINSLGLRDREINIEKGDKYRILCFGDSWTFGYGVNIENSWPKVLEQYLLTNGFKNIEVINCGRPGQFTGTYKKFMEKTVPLLKPDLVLVGVLQLDDLAQLFTNNFIIEQSGPIETFIRKGKSVVIRYIKYSFKNFLSPSRMIEITSNWKKTSTSRISDFKHWQKLRFSTFNDSVQSLFKSGNLAPSLLDYYINYPDRIAIFNNPNHPATKFSIQEMNKDFKEMRDICYNNNSNLIFINIPMNYFTGHTVIRTPSDILNSYFKTNNNIDSIYRSIANTNNIPYIELTNHFIGLQNKSEYLFKYDGHPNKKGYEEIAKYIGKRLIEKNYLQ
ncbi:MAG: hypothetical protein GWP19_08840, partial [Planctomycetia bacterium]|nr:hypothetical protein [Planctomycetia bacterium]